MDHLDKYMQRKRRGWAENNELFPYKEKQLAELIELLSSKEAHERTISAKLLPINCDTVNILLHSLIKEPALYTRLAITEKLESGDSMTAQQMIPFLAEIGTNQHRFPVAPSKKKSFPLPRDLIARSLGRMKPEIFPVLLKAATQLPNSKLRELIDAIGYMAFYNPSLATVQNYQSLLEIRNSYKSDLLIQWKFLICFSAFPQSKALLVEEEQFIPEAQRSLIILNTKRVE
ncbi:hypothetical protein RU95_GL001976 [Enterococcus avium]|nr:hypothetical protein RU95_GL001976 [Enterococcus avium]